MTATLTPPQAGVRPAVDTALLQALAHPIRVRIMRAAVERFSPKQIADELGDDVSLQLVSYHVRILNGAGLLELVGTAPRRGALEHFYRASREADERLGTAARSLGVIAEELEAARS